MEKSENINELAAALAKAQGEMTAARKDAINPHFGKTYATLASAIEASRLPLSKNNLSFSQFVETNNTLTTILFHSSGQWLKSTMSFVTVKNDMQGLGSAITYAKRYALCAMLGIASEDDDGNEATGKPAPTKSMAPPSPVINKNMEALKAAMGKKWTRDEVCKVSEKLYNNANPPELNEKDLLNLIEVVKSTDYKQKMAEIDFLESEI